MKIERMGGGEEEFEGMEWVEMDDVEMKWGIKRIWK